ncbi:MAG TPA: lipopolysaccharide biosynthesis protein [Gallicola sp.]|nr:lipopolysaccharide biosynthesis protein [Gallicola sp.]
MLYFRMILTMIVSLYTSRVILNTLGVEDYGIYNVVGGVVSMFAFFNSAMSSATQRFLSYEIGKGDFAQLRKTFNATQIIHIGIAILIFILAETIGLWFVRTNLVIPPERIDAALWVYHFSVLSFMVTVIQVPYNATIIAHERMNVYAYVSIIEVVLKLLIVFMLTWITYDKLKLYGILLFVVVFFVAAIYRIYTRRNFKETKFLIVNDKNLYKSLFSFSGWNLLGNAAVIIRGQGVNIILNLFFGPAVNAARGIAYQIQSALYSFVLNFQMAMKPQIIKSFALDDFKYMHQLVFRGSKFSFYLLFCLSLPVIFEAETILNIWLVEVPDYTIIFLRLIIIDVLIESVAGQLVTAAHASGKIKLYQSIVALFFVLNLPISYLLLEYGYEPQTVMYVSIVLTSFNLFVRINIVSKLAKFEVVDFMKKVLFPIFLVVAVSIVIPLIIKSLMSNGIVEFFIMIITSILSIVNTIYFIGLNKNERSFVKIKMNALILKLK